MSDCTHDIVGEGPRLPLQHGSAPTEVCMRCGVWRDAREEVRYRPAIKWREPRYLLIAIATVNDE